MGETPGFENNFSSSSGTQDGGPGMRFTFDENDVANFDRLRCYKPVILNKNVSSFGLLIDKSNSFWKNGSSKGEENIYAERKNQNIPV